MAEPRLYYPLKPQRLNQGFGGNPDYYARFKDSFGNPLKGHNGLDIQAVHGEPVYAAHDGHAFFKKDDHGGEGICIIGDGFETIYWHLIGDTDAIYPSPIPTDGLYHEVKAGDLIGYADNTGAPFESSGTHLHFALALLDAHGAALGLDNGYNGYVDPTPYFNGYYAVDAQTVLGYYQALLISLQSLVGALSNKQPTT